MHSILKSCPQYLCTLHHLHGQQQVCLLKISAWTRRLCWNGTHVFRFPWVSWESCPWSGTTTETVRLFLSHITLAATLTLVSGPGSTPPMTYVVKVLIPLSHFVSHGGGRAVLPLEQPHHKPATAVFNHKNKVCEVLWHSYGIIQSLTHLTSGSKTAALDDAERPGWVSARGEGKASLMYGHWQLDKLN